MSHKKRFILSYKKRFILSYNLLKILFSSSCQYHMAAGLFFLFCSLGQQFNKSTLQNSLTPPPPRSLQCGRLLPPWPPRANLIIVWTYYISMGIIFVYCCSCVYFSSSCILVIKCNKLYFNYFVEY